MDLIPFVYQAIAIQEACWIDGKPYFTRRAIGEVLGARHPQDYIKKIVKRNPHIQVFSTGVNLSLVEGGRTITRPTGPISGSSVRWS